MPEEYLGRYAPIDPAKIHLRDIVIYPNWAAMYMGNGMVLNANEFEGFVTHTSRGVAGESLGIVRPPYLQEHHRGESTSYRGRRSEVPSRSGALGVKDYVKK